MRFRSEIFLLILFVFCNKYPSHKNEIELLARNAIAKSILNVKNSVYEAGLPDRGSGIVYYDLLTSSKCEPYHLKSIYYEGDVIFKKWELAFNCPGIDDSNVYVVVSDMNRETIRSKVLAVRFGKLKYRKN